MPNTAWRRLSLAIDKCCEKTTNSTFDITGCFETPCIMQGFIKHPRVENSPLKHFTPPGEGP